MDRTLRWFEMRIGEQISNQYNTTDEALMKYYDAFLA